MNTRPLSPHLQIYKLPLAALISISHRLAAVIIFSAIAFIGLYALLYFVGMDVSFIDALVFSVFGKVIISLLAGCLSFYCAAEVRYIIWGFNCGLSPKFVSISNYLIILATVGLFALCMQTIWGV